MQFYNLESETQFSQILDLSNSEHLKGVAIFKHSTRCSISYAAWSKLQRQWLWDDTQLPIYYLDLLQYRPISNQITHDFSVEHQSPQLLIIKNGKCIYTSSHNGILAAEIKQVIFDT
jgi:bacillithiol system protein YtxJ